MKHWKILMVALAVMLVVSFALAVTSLIIPRPVLAKPPEPDCIWYGCLCEEIEYAWECVGQANPYRCCDTLCWNGYWQCLSGYYISCGVPPGCDTYSP